MSAERRLPTTATGTPTTSRPGTTCRATAAAGSSMVEATPGALPGVGPSRRCPPVLCLHGGGQTAYMFEELGAALASTHHVLAPDLPSHGDSDPAAAGEWGRHVIAATIPPLLATFGIDRAVFVGASLGGITSITVAAAHPDLVAGHRAHRRRPPARGGRRPQDRRLHAARTSRSPRWTRRRPRSPSTSRTAREVRPESLTRNLRHRKDGRWVWKHGFGRRYREQATGGLRRRPWRDVARRARRRRRRPALPGAGAARFRERRAVERGAEEVAALIPDARLRRSRRPVTWPRVTTRNRPSGSSPPSWANSIGAVRPLTFKRVDREVHPVLG